MKKIPFLFSVLCLFFMVSVTIPPTSETSAVTSVISCSTTGLSVKGITTTTADFSYLACGSQVIEHGVCYSTGSQPVLGSSNRVAGYLGAAKEVYETKTFFNVKAARLNPATKYYARAYVKNSAGQVVYSPEISFTTLRPSK